MVLMLAFWASAAVYKKSPTAPKFGYSIWLLSVSDPSLYVYQLYHFLSPSFFSSLSISYIYIYIYICAVELKTGPMFAFFSVKNWSFFFVFEHLVLPAERRGFFKKEEKLTKWAISSVKNWSNFVAQHTWTNFNASLDLSLTLGFFGVFFSLLKPLFL